jgi:prolyl-tRNA synthetase
MKDAYSFDVDQAGLDKCYQKMLDAYKKIFKECGLSVITTEADSGAMGGSVSHEFMVPADIGEDILYYCQGCDLYFSQDVCPQCNNNGQQQQKAIEIGHIFKLGTKYSETQDACFLDDAGVKKPIIMGCYGIGVSRLLPAIVEQNHDQQGIIWPRAISCFDANILLLKPDDSQLSDAAVQAYDKIQAAGFDVLLDDRQQGPGVKFNDAYLIGSPYIIIVGKKFRQTNLFEVEKRSDGEKQELTLEQLINYLKTEYERK